MKKRSLAFLLVLLSTFFYAQFGSIDAVLNELEMRKGLKGNNVSNISIDQKKFVSIKDFEDHTERRFIILQGKNATYVEVFDDKKSGKSTSNVFTGDFIRSKKNIISIRADQLEGKKISIPITKVLLLTKQKKVIYLLDLNTKERWIDEQSF